MNFTNTSVEFGYNNNHKLIAINGMPDHIYILFGYRPSQSLSDLMQDIKDNSSKWINEKRFVNGKFSWQEDYGAFLYSKSEVPGVIQYIMNQSIHHKSKTITEEYTVRHLAKKDSPTRKIRKIESRCDYITTFA